MLAPMQRLDGVVPEVLVRLQRRAPQDAQHVEPQLRRLPLLHCVDRGYGRRRVRRPVRQSTSCGGMKTEPSASDNQQQNHDTELVTSTELAMCKGSVENSA